MKPSRLPLFSTFCIAVVVAACSDAKAPAASPVAAVSTSHPAPAASSGGASLLLGIWHSDLDLSRKYIEANVQAEASSKRVLEQMLGHMTLTFTRNQVTLDSPAFKLERPDKTVPIDAVHNVVSYAVAKESADQVTVGFVLMGNPDTETYHFEGKDTMWTSIGGSKTPDAREYYTRVK